METKDKKTEDSLIERMFKAGAHYGYSRTRRHPSFVDFIYGAKNKIDIIDLEKTATCLSEALEFIKKCAEDKKTILFVGTKPEAQKAIDEFVIPMGSPYVSYRWIGGTLTNFPEIKKRVSRFQELTSKVEKGELEVYTKKERHLFEKEREKLMKNFGGIVSLTQTPDALFIIDPREETTAINEAKRKGIQVVALAGSDCDLQSIKYPIPANDSALASIRFFVEQATNTYKNTAPKTKDEAKEKDNSS
jgi:small subunit ribosomal protein S2